MRQSPNAYPFDPVREIPNAWVADEAKYGYNWSLSPDGTTLVFAQKLGSPKVPTLRFFTIADGSQRMILVPGWTGIGSLDWAADGKSVWMFTYTATDEFALLNANVQGKIRTMFEEKSMTLGWAIPSPDGQHLAFWKASGNANVWMLENF